MPREWLMQNCSAIAILDNMFIEVSEKPGSPVA